MTPPDELPLFRVNPSWYENYWLTDTPARSSRLLAINRAIGVARTRVGRLIEGRIWDTLAVGRQARLRLNIW